MIAYETAGTQGLYPWKTPREAEPFTWITLFPDRVLEELPRSACVQAMREALERDRPRAVAAVGYARPECMAMLTWARSARRPAVLMSESQAIDHPRVWWKEAVKRRRVRRFDAGLVGGPRHRDYLVSLGLPAEQIVLGYNAVDGEAFAAEAEAHRRAATGREGIPSTPYFVAVNRFVPEKNLVALVEAFAHYHHDAKGAAWDLVLCGDGPGAKDVERAIAASGCAHAIHRPGFLQADQVARWLAFASAFVHPSLLEPWGLVVNEAAACGLPLLVSDRAGCVETFVPPDGPLTGRWIDGRDVPGMTRALAWMAGLSEDDRRAMGDRAASIAQAWGPDRFARGALDAFEIAEQVNHTRFAGRRRAVSSV